MDYKVNMLEHLDFFLGTVLNGKERDFYGNINSRGNKAVINYKFKSYDFKMHVNLEKETVDIESIYPPTSEYNLFSFDFSTYKENGVVSTEMTSVENSVKAYGSRSKQRVIYHDNFDLSSEKSFELLDGVSYAIDMFRNDSLTELQEERLHCPTEEIEINNIVKEEKKWKTFNKKMNKTVF